MKGSLHPILTCEAAADYEAAVLTDEDAEWEAMSRAGRSLGQRILLDYNEVRSLPPAPRILLLLGKGHNSGDACLAADEILKMVPDAEISLYLLAEEADMRPLTRRAYDLIADRAMMADEGMLESYPLEVCIDGLFGMQFRPPLREPARGILQGINGNPSVDLRAAVDIPSGLGDPDGFRADITYATGIAKAPIFEETNRERVGRIRYLDIGFFPEGGEPFREDAPFLLTPNLLRGIRSLRPAGSDKRSQGHLFLVAGSRNMPGAMLMCARAAATAGVGLLTVFGPESMVPYLVGHLPEAMWVPYPETPGGGLAMEGRREILRRLDRADAVVFGPGMGREPETAQLLDDILGEIRAPVLLDADAIQPGVVSAAVNRPKDYGPVVLTPHQGEYERICGRTGPREFARQTGAVLVLKGPMTRIFCGESCFVSPYGGPILARGGTGDLLAGMIGARLASSPEEVLRAACEGVVWHGRSADEWARERGSAGVRTTGLLDFLPEGLFYE